MVVGEHSPLSGNHLLGQGRRYWIDRGQLPKRGDALCIAVNRVEDDGVPHGEPDLEDFLELILGSPPPARPRGGLRSPGRFPIDTPQNCRPRRSTLARVAFHGPLTMLNANPQTGPVIGRRCVPPTSLSSPVTTDTGTPCESRCHRRGAAGNQQGNVFRGAVSRQPRHPLNGALYGGGNRWQT